MSLKGPTLRTSRALESSSSDKPARSPKRKASRYISRISRPKFQYIPMCSTSLPSLYMSTTGIHVYTDSIRFYSCNILATPSTTCNNPYTPCKRSPVYALRTASCKQSREATAFSRAARARASDHIQFQPQKEPSKKMNKVSHSKSQ